MRYFFIIALIAFLSCNNNSTEQTSTIKTKDTTEIIIPDTPTNGVLNKEYYPNGNVRVIGYNVNNKREGEWIYYFENGKVWSRGTFINGQSDGKFSIYDKEGNLFIESYYVLGNKTQEIYYKDDKLYKTVLFD